MKTIRRYNAARLILSGVVPAALLVAGCGDDPVAVDPVTTMQKTGTTDNQSAAAGTIVPQSPEVTLLTAGGAKAVGETVTFTVQSGGGTVTGAMAITDQRGTARVSTWTLGQVATPNTLMATASGLAVTFTAIGIPGPAAMVALSDGSEQFAPVNTEVAVRPEVLVGDQFGNGVQGVTVQWRVLRGAGLVIGDNSVISEPDGLARVGGWQLGPTVGENILEATVQGFPTVQFRATGTP